MELDTCPRGFQPDAGERYFWVDASWSKFSNQSNSIFSFFDPLFLLFICCCCLFVARIIESILTPKAIKEGLPSLSDLLKDA